MAAARLGEPAREALRLHIRLRELLPRELMQGIDPAGGDTQYEPGILNLDQNDPLARSDRGRGHHTDERAR